MNPNLLKLLGLLGAGGMIAGPLATIADKEKDPEMLPSDSEEAKILQAEKQAMRDYQASPARKDRLSAMTQDEMDSQEMEELEKARQYKLEALKKLRNGF